jgi:hypothetical protein
VSSKHLLLHVPVAAIQRVISVKSGGGMLNSSACLTSLLLCPCAQTMHNWQGGAHKLVLCMKSKVKHLFHMCVQEEVWSCAAVAHQQHLFFVSCSMILPMLLTLLQLTMWPAALYPFTIAFCCSAKRSLI